MFWSQHFFFFLQVNAPIWTLPTREHDGLTTNGVAFMRPTGSFESGVHPGEWREVTVMGNVCKLRPQRSSRTPGEMVSQSINERPCKPCTCVPHVVYTVICSYRISYNIISFGNLIGRDSFCNTFTSTATFGRVGNVYRQASLIHVPLGV